MSENTLGNPMSDPNNWLTQDFADMILDELKETFNSDRNWLMVLLLLTTGRRVGELIQLKVKDIRWEQSMILWHIEKKHRFIKDDEGYYIPNDDPKKTKKFKTEKVDKRVYKSIDSRTLNYLREYIEAENLLENDYVFYSPIKGNKTLYHLDRRSVWKIINKVGKALNMNLHPHTFRHTFAVWIAQNMRSPADLKKLRDLLEHSDTKVTENYLQFATHETKDLLEKTFGGKEDDT